MSKNSKSETTNQQKINEKELLKPRPEYNLIQMVRLIERGQRHIASLQKRIGEEQQNIEKMKAKIIDHFSAK